MLKFTL